MRSGGLLGLQNRCKPNRLIAPDVANIFINSIASMLKIDEVTELQRRLASIEESLGVGNA
ncbi:hypothetical protein [Psychromonas sp. CD1]|uniref:hypothetical protein n=1 Tax=Psychromonas sp. CD1 TaxID=1979839 RepID=UPI000B9B8D10|nr:hypothetical protein [Psychromonas sp. CD1]